MNIFTVTGYSDDVVIVRKNGEVIHHLDCIDKRVQVMPEDLEQNFCVIAHYSTACADWIFSIGAFNRENCANLKVNNMIVYDNSDNKVGESKYGASFMYDGEVIVKTL